MKMENQCQFVRTHQRKASNEGFMYSTDSILSLMNNFVKAVGVMEETVLVPSRLMDVAVASNQEPHDLSPSAQLLHKTVPKWAGKSQQDLFNFFNAVKQVHNTLMWGGKDKLESAKAANNLNLIKQQQQQQQQQQQRLYPQPTVTVSSASVSGASVSGMDSPGATSVTSVDNSDILPTGSAILRQPSATSLVSGFEEGGIDDEVDASSAASSADESSDSGLDQEQSARDDTLRQMSERFSGHLCGLLDCLQEFTAVAHVVSQRYQEEVGNC